MTKTINLSIVMCIYKDLDNLVEGHKCDRLWELNSRDNHWLAARRSTINHYDKRINKYFRIDKAFIASKYVWFCVGSHLNNKCISQLFAYKTQYFFQIFFFADNLEVHIVTGKCINNIFSDGIPHHISDGLTKNKLYLN